MAVRTIDGYTGELVVNTQQQNFYGSYQTDHYYHNNINETQYLQKVNYAPTTFGIPLVQATTYKNQYIVEPGETTYNIVQPTTTIYNTNQPFATQDVSAEHISSGEIIKGQSRIEYIPFQQTITDYEIQEYIERVPKQRTITQFQQRRYVETVPREVSKVDYYAIEYVRQYIPQIIPETKVQMVPIQRTITRTEYIPVERKIIHYPQASLDFGFNKSTQVHQGIIDERSTRKGYGGAPNFVTQNVTQGVTYQTQALAPLEKQLVVKSNSNRAIEETYVTSPTYTATEYSNIPIAIQSYSSGHPININTTYAHSYLY